MFPISKQFASFKSVKNPFSKIMERVNQKSKCFEENLHKLSVFQIILSNKLTSFFIKPKTQKLHLLYRLPLLLLFSHIFLPNSQVLTTKLITCMKLDNSSVSRCTVISSLLTQRCFKKICFISFIILIRKTKMFKYKVCR